MIHQIFLHTEINQYFSKSDYMKILTNVKNKLIDILLKLEKEFGNLDDLDINTESKKPKELKKLNQTIINIIYSDNSIKSGDKNKMQDTNIGSDIDEN